MIVSERHRARVGIQSLGAAECDRRGAEPCETGGGALQNRGSFQEIENAQARGKPGRTRGRQYMVRTAYIVADGLGRISSEKNSTRVADPLTDRLGVSGKYLKMLGGKPVGERDAFLKTGNKDNRAEIAPARRRDFFAR